MQLKASLARTDFSEGSAASLASFSVGERLSMTRSGARGGMSGGGGGVSNFLLPRCCWSRRFSDDFSEHKEFSVSVYEGMRLAGLGLRMKRYIGMFFVFLFLFCFVLLSFIHSLFIVFRC